MTSALNRPVLNEELFPGNTSAFAALKQFVLDGRITAFTGAGVSIPIFPSWTGLLCGLIDDAIAQGLIPRDASEYRSLAAVDPLELAEQLELAFSKEVFRARLAGSFRNTDGHSTECHRLICSLKSKGIVTLNYDDGHETAYAALTGRAPNSGKAQDSATLTRWVQNEVFIDHNCPILHFHGEISDPNQMVITSSDYDRFYSQGLADTFIGQLWRSERLLVIGFGFTDPFLTKIAERALRTLESDTRHYALIGREAGEPVSAMQRQIFARKYRLIPIFYEVRQDKTANGTIPNHTDLLSILKALPERRISAPEPIVSSAEGSERNIEARSSVERDFRSDLFVAPNGNTLHVEPRFQVPETITADNAVDTEFMSVTEIAKDTASYIITCRQEHGATNVARRLVLEFSSLGKRALLRDASLLPNYKKKLEEAFFNLGFADQDANAVLILDNFDEATNDRLLKEIIGTKRFARIIVLARQTLFDLGGNLPVDQFSIPFKSLSLLSLRRADIRTLTTQFYDSSDPDTISTIVEKIYGDLVTLCIPIIPSNVIMYLSILFKEGDFQPINRVEIVERYLSNLLLSPSDIYRDVFNARNKMDVLSAFVFRLYEENKITFSEADWFIFCRFHMSATLTEFDERALLSLLKSNRIFIPIGPNLYFKYHFFHTFLLGRHIASRPKLMTKFMEESQYLRHQGLVEVIANLASDNEPLINDIVEKLEQAQAEFGEKYVPESYDPFLKLQWPVHNREDETLWQPLAKSLAAGPRNAAEIDEIKSSFFGERFASDQKVVVRDFTVLERRMVALHRALIDALRDCDNLAASLKTRAVLTAWKGYLNMLQVGLFFAPVLARRPFFHWHGLTFINGLNDTETMTANELRRS